MEVRERSSRSAWPAIAHDCSSLDDSVIVAAFQDGQRAVTLVRSKAKEWGISADRIGMIGFSAGGGVTGHVLLNPEKRSYKEVDAVDQIGHDPSAVERVCDVLMETARRGSGPRSVANWQDDKTVLAFLFDDHTS